MDRRGLPGSDSDGVVGVLGALGAGLGVLLSVVLDGNPLLWASAGGVAGLIVGLLAVESS
ncbi:hypothetical protein [Halobaculum sp. D14]|uniref:hypothetical protein n=1 Tax=Halobaculum sp. D14 TaxID=3421642 RepID=UPI003EC09D60